MTRAQLAKVLVLAFELTLTETLTFDDVPATHWSSSYIATLASYGIATGEDHLFKPNEPVTRAQFAAMLYRVLQISQ